MQSWLPCSAVLWLAEGVHSRPSRDPGGARRGVVRPGRCASGARYDCTPHRSIINITCTVLSIRSVGTESLCNPPADCAMRQMRFMFGSISRFSDTCNPTNEVPRFIQVARGATRSGWAPAPPGGLAVRPFRLVASIVRKQRLDEPQNVKPAPN